MSDCNFFEITLYTGKTFVTDHLEELCWNWSTDYSLALKAMSGDPKDALWGMTGHRIPREEFERRKAEEYM